jgi:hypothetical protein
MRWAILIRRNSPNAHSLMAKSNAIFLILTVGAAATSGQNDRSTLQARLFARF